MNYKVTKIGLLNFWLYDEEEYDFSDGKLLLRGENGSGKSVTMQSFIPLILDGNKAPSRLDPFGGTDKHIEAYLLGGYDTIQKDEATGYLYMEMYDESMNKYITIGMGLYAKKGRPVNFWGFSLVDGRRINKDFWLYKNKHEKVPFSKNELKAALGNDNTLVDSTKEYKKMVNNLVFGFPSLDQYDEFINVLLQLRRPKLSTDYKPTKLMSILSSVLQPLSEEDLAPLSETIEEMDKTKERVEQLKKDIRDVTYLKKSYSNYNEAILYRKAFNFLESIKVSDKYSSDITNQEKLILDTMSEVDDLKKKIDDNEVEYETSLKERNSIDSKDIDKATSRITEISGLVSKLESENNKYNSDKEKYDEKRISIENDNKDKENQNYVYTKEIRETTNDIVNDAESVSLSEINVSLEDILEEKSNIDFSYINSRVRAYLSKLNVVRDKLKEKSDYEIKLGEEESVRDKINSEYDKLLSKYEKLEEDVSYELQNIKDEISLLQSNNKYVRFNDLEKDEFLGYFKEYSRENYYASKKIYENLAIKYFKDTSLEVAKLGEKINRSNETLEELNSTLEELKSKKEEEIIVDDEVSETVQFLSQNNISYVPFYKAVEFKDTVEAQVRDRLESVLMTAGILGSFIIDKKDIKKVSGHKGLFLVSSSKKNNNLSNYFKVSDNIEFDVNVVKSVLESISTNQEDLITVNDEEFKMDYILGFGSKVSKSKFIGILAREEARKLRIKEQEDKIQAEREVNKQLVDLRDKKNDELTGITIEKEKFPSNSKLDSINNEQNSVSISMDFKQGELDKVNEKIKVISEKLSELFASISEFKKEIRVNLSIESVVDAINTINEMLENLRNLETTYNKYKNNLEFKVVNDERIQEIDSMVDDLLVKLHNNEIEISKLKKEKKNLEDLMNTDEFRDLSKKILELNEKIERLPKDKENFIRTLGKQEEALETLARDMERLNLESIKKNRECEIKKKFFEDEYSLGYVFDDELDGVKSAKMVIDKLSNRKDADMNKIKENYMNQYSEYHLKLQDYKLAIVNLFDVSVSEEDMEFKELYDNAVRNDYMVTYQGKNMSLFALERELENTIVENDEIIDEQDRKLFGEILLQTVGKKIREHIELSKEWVKGINDIMKNMQSDAALSFQLEWKGKDIEGEDEVDTKELIRLFKISSSIISDEDKAKLRNHFMSKLKKQVEVLNDTHDSYTNIIFNILDYRSWFEFKLYYIRNGENKRELTDKIFSVFSGGEKAKTMYLPLFTAIASKLKSARSNALRLVALDEAFAGVDDSNIREMFGILSKLDLDYILTSQALWGDYDTIKEMSICELLRPNNSQVVGVRRYHWDGNVRNFVHKEEEDYESLGVF